METHNDSDAGNATSSTIVKRDEEFAKIEILFQCIILFLAASGNGFVLLVLGVQKKKLSRMNILIVHLTVADLFVAFFNILPQLIWDITYRFRGNDFLCRSVKYLQVVAMYASAYVLVTTAVDRYLVICHPLTSQTWSPRRVHLLVLVAWLLSLLFSVPQLLIFSYQQLAPGVHDCWGEFTPTWTLQLYITWITLAIYVVPAVLLAVLYGNICTAVSRCMVGRTSFSSMSKGGYHKVRRGSPTRPVESDYSSVAVPNRLTVSDCRPGGHPRAHVRLLSRSKVKTVKLTLTVVACYLLCWGPFFFAQMWAAWDENAPFNNDVMVIILLMASLNSCTNPWIYMAFSDNVRIRTCWWRRQPQSDKSTRFNLTLLCSIDGATLPTTAPASMRSGITGAVRCGAAGAAGAAGTSLAIGASLGMPILKRHSVVRNSRKLGLQMVNAV